MANSELPNPTPQDIDPELDAELDEAARRRYGQAGRDKYFGDITEADNTGKKLVRPGETAEDAHSRIQAERDQNNQDSP